LGEGGIERFLVLKDAIGHAEEVVHDGTDDAHLRFASGSKTLGAHLEAGVAAAGDDGGEVERLTEPAVAGFAKACFPAQ